MCFLWSLGYLLSRSRPALFTCPAAWRPAALRSFASQFCHQRLFLSLGSSLKNVGGRVLTSLTWARCSSLDRVLRGSYPSSSGMRGRGTGRSAPGNGRGARHLTLDAMHARPRAEGALHLQHRFNFLRCACKQVLFPAFTDQKEAGDFTSCG